MQNDFQLFCHEANLGDVYVYQNGVQPIQMHRSQCISLKQIKRIILTKQPNTSIKFFNHKCQEIYEEDVRFIKNKIYLTKNGASLNQKVVFFEFDSLNVIGKGGQAAVMLVQHKVTGIQRALKFNLQDQEDQYLYLAREAVILENLNHKNIIKLYQHKLFPDKSEAILELEYLKGGSLLDYIYENGPMSENLARHIFKQIIDGLEYCHQKNIIHRDLKLENILISNIDSFNIKIIDFGLAYISGTEYQQYNRGPLDYTSPESLLDDKSSMLFTADIWSLGVILYYLIFATYPFQGQDSKQTKENILKSNIQFQKSITDELQSLFKAIFTLDVKLRIKLIDIKKHSWMSLGRFQQQTKKSQLQEQWNTSKETLSLELTFRQATMCSNYLTQQSKQ